MRVWSCSVCEQMVFFENFVCLHCGSQLRVRPDTRDVVVVDEGPSGELTARGSDDVGWLPCANEDLAKCNWLTVPGEDAEGLCVSCRLTSTRPNDADAEALEAFAAAEMAKRRLVFQLGELGLSVTGRDRSSTGLGFDLLSSSQDHVITGHADGLITLNLAESDDAYRARMRDQLGESYRTLLGHFRHEVGHYYEAVLVDGTSRLEPCRGLFGDERQDYGEAINRHYNSGPPADWPKHYVTAYATMHPWEDWAETFAHYLHIQDTLQTAAAFGVLVGGPLNDNTGRRNPTFAAVPDMISGDGDFRAIFDEWLPLTYALNGINRSMGEHDLYPFVLTATVFKKLAFVHACVTTGQRGAA